MSDTVTKKRGKESEQGQKKNQQSCDNDIIQPDGSLRPDQAAIAELVPEGARVLDVGCGTGTLLAWLAAHKQVEGHGLELSQQKVSEAVESGISVIQGDADVDLAYYPDNAFDYAILSRTLQATRNPEQVLEHIVRIARHAIIGVPNFGHWRNRLYLLLQGRMPVTKFLTYQWYDTPNIHFCTIKDFILLCEEKGLQIEKKWAITMEGQRSPIAGRGWLANLLGEQGVFMLQRKQHD